MHIVVCIAPIVDPTAAAERLTTSEDGRRLGLNGVKRQLGPFDEAALEVALKLRDADPDTRLTVIALAAAEDEACLRSAMALRVDAAIGLEVPEEARWDHGRVCRALGAGIRAAGAPADLVLLGREFGDQDDGVVPPLLAEHLGRPFFGLCHRAVRRGGEIECVREVGAAEERVTLALPAVISVTNHPETRLRLPLLKNVFAARRQPIVGVSHGAEAAERGVTVVRAGIVAASARGHERCRLVTGSPDEQAAELARFLTPWVRTA